MTRLEPSELPAFLRRFRFAGGRLSRVRMRYQGDGLLTIEVVVAIRPKIQDLGDAPKGTRVRLRFVGVDEFRFQKRLAQPAGRVAEARLGYLDGRFFLNLDAFGLDPTDTPKVHDYRASDAYLAGATLEWEEVAKPG